MRRLHFIDTYFDLVIIATISNQSYFINQISFHFYIIFAVIQLQRRQFNENSPIFSPFGNGRKLGAIRNGNNMEGMTKYFFDQIFLQLASLGHNELAIQWLQN